MAKRQHLSPQARRRRKVQKKKTNWPLIVGIILAGVVALGALLALTASDPPAETLAGYCDDNPERCIVEGAADAPVTIVNVSDYGCIHCRNFAMGTEALLEETYVATGQVRYIVLPFALQAQTVPPAEAALCAVEQGGYERIHQALFSLQDNPTGFDRSSILAVASGVDLEMDAFAGCLDSRKYQATVESNIQAARRSGVSSTPSFFINGVKLTGNQPFEVFQQQITSLLDD
jgi:protein-disulfide isomerase